MLRGVRWELSSRTRRFSCVAQSLVLIICETHKDLRMTSLLSAPDLRQVAILLDVDGTILDFAPTPREVFVSPALRADAAAPAGAHRRSARAGERAAAQGPRSPVRTAPAARRSAAMAPRSGRRRPGRSIGGSTAARQGAQAPPRHHRGGRRPASSSRTRITASPSTIVLLPTRRISCAPRCWPLRGARALRGRGAAGQIRARDQERRLRQGHRRALVDARKPFAAAGRSSSATTPPTRPRSRCFPSSTASGFRSVAASRASPLLRCAPTTCACGSSRSRISSRRRRNDAPAPAPCSRPSARTRKQRGSKSNCGGFFLRDTVRGPMLYRQTVLLQGVHVQMDAIRGHPIRPSARIW